MSRVHVLLYILNLTTAHYQNVPASWLIKARPVKRYLKRCISDSTKIDSKKDLSYLDNDLRGGVVTVRCGQV